MNNYRDQLPPVTVTTKIEEALGRDIVCDDGVTRNVHSIMHSVGNFANALVNYSDTEAGWPVNLLKLMHQLQGKPEPTEEEQTAFDMIAKSFNFEYVGQKQPKRKSLADLKVVKEYRGFSGYKGKK